MKFGAAEKAGSEFFLNFCRKTWMLCIAVIIYDMSDYFTVMGRQVPVRDEWISKALKNFLQKAGNYFDALFSGYDGERNRCLPEIGAEYRALS